MDTSTSQRHCRLARSLAPFAALLLLSAFPMRAVACTISGPPVAQTAGEIAANGVVISGRVIQTFDAKKRQPEIIRADEVFIGDFAPQNFVIYYSERDYASEIELRKLEKQGKLLCPGALLHYKSGQTFERLVLMPAKASENEAAEGKWSFHFWGTNVLMGVGFEMLLDEAKRLGRLNARPPKSKQWGDCMECVPRNDR
jgi:hypothetical protein